MQQRLQILFDVIKRIEVQMLITTQPAVKFAGFSREREIRIREIRRVGREERHQECEAMLKARGTTQVRILHPSQT